MRMLFLSTILAIICIGCEKYEFDPNNPEVKKFVQQLKNGTYDYYEKGENGEDLWLIMPNFVKHHIQSLIDFSIDTSHINDFPVNPVSSRTPFPNDRQYFILGECLLWTVEGIRNGTGYGSLDPYLIDTSLIEYHRGLKGYQLLVVRSYYQDWWSIYQDGDWKEKNPLEGSPYGWF